VTPVPIFTAEVPQRSPPRQLAKTAALTRGGPAANQIHEESHAKHPKSAALKALYAIAGDDWDTSRNIEKSLSTAQSKFQCPASEGHFPDPDNCEVYYQCAHGTSTKYHCQGGLKWNVNTDQCDWETNVDCSLNSVPGSGGGRLYRYYKY